MDGLVAHVANHFELDPFDGAVYVFRSRRADRLKLLVWDGTGLVLTMKRLNGGGSPGRSRRPGRWCSPRCSSTRCSMASTGAP